MRLSKGQIARAFNVDQKRLESAVARGIVHADSDGLIDFRIAMAWARSTSTEAVQLFGDTVRMPAPDAVYARNVDIASISNDDLVGESRLDLFEYGLAHVGRITVQALDPEAWAARHGGSLTTKNVGVCILLRETDTTEDRAITDAYLLGDARLRDAVTKFTIDHGRLFLARR